MQRKIERVMLLNPANTMPKDSVRRLPTPLGLMYLASELRKRDYHVEILDSTCEGYYQTRVKGDSLTYGLSDEEVVRRIKSFSPDIVGVTSMFTAQQGDSLHHCDLVKSVLDVPVILGGIHPSLDPIGSLSHPSVDFVILGEGEYRLPNLLEAINSGKNPEFDGVAYKEMGRKKIIPQTTRIENLDSLSFPARDLINLEHYLTIGVPYAPFPRKKRVEGIMATRGCPFNCNFCSTVNYWGRKHRKRSIDNIFSEMEELKERYHIEEVQFLDDNLTIDKGWSKDLFSRISKLGLALCFPHGLMIQTLDSELLEAMAKAGTYQISIAVESASSRVLKEIIGKPVPPKEKVKSLVALAQSRGIQVHGLFIVGFPGEKLEELHETLRYPTEVGFDSASFFIANPMPGSRLYFECEKKGYLSEVAKGNVKHAEIHIPSSSPDYVMSGQELEQLVDKTAREFNERAKQKDPQGWNTKFEQFLKRHGDNANLILGRVT